MARAVVLTITVALTVVGLSWAEQTPATGRVPATIEELEHELRSLVEQAASLQQQIRGQRKVVSDQDVMMKTKVGQLERLEQRQEQLKKELVDARKTLQEKHKEKMERLTAVKAAQAELKKAQERLAAAESMAKEASQAVLTSQQTATDLENQLKELEPQRIPLQQEAKQASQASQAVHADLNELERRLIAHQNQQSKVQLDIENRLRQEGRWVSFKQKIAPIFQKHCVACHNVANPQGRYNMASYQALMAPGESGLAIIAEDAAGSPLYQYLLDGWMPYETDPLIETEIELVRQWIDLGARLDHLVDPAAPLIRYIPRPQQPPAPERYRSPVPVTAMAVDAEQRFLAVSGYREVLLWALDDSPRLIQRFGDVAERIYGLDFHPSGDWLAVAAGTPGQFGEVQLIRVDNPVEARIHLWASEDVMFDAAFSPAGDRLAACSADGSIVLFERDEQNRQAKSAFDGSTVIYSPDHSDWVQQIAWSPDGRWLATASRDKTAKVFDGKTGQLQRTFSAHNQPVQAVAFLDNDTIATGGEDQRLRIWSRTDGKQARAIAGFNGPITDLHAVNAKALISVGTDQRVQRHLADSGERSFASSALGSWLSVVVGTADGKTIFLGDQQGRVHRLRGEKETTALYLMAMPADDKPESVPGDSKPQDQDASPEQDEQ